jgi:hypothetical protein
MKNAPFAKDILFMKGQHPMTTSLHARPISVVIVSLLVTLALLFMTTPVSAGITTTKADRFVEFTEYVDEYDAVIDAFDADWDPDFGVERDYYTDLAIDTFAQLVNLRTNLWNDVNAHACFENTYWDFYNLLDHHVGLMGMYTVLTHQHSGTPILDDAYELVGTQIEWSTEQMVESYTKANRKCN